MYHLALYHYKTVTMVWEVFVGGKGWERVVIFKNLKNRFGPEKPVQAGIRGSKGSGGGNLATEVGVMGQ